MVGRRINKIGRFLKMSKYKNKDGIELSYNGHKGDAHADLIKEVIREAINLINSGVDKEEVIDFLSENFSVHIENEKT